MEEEGKEADLKRVWSSTDAEDDTYHKKRAKVECPSSSMERTVASSSRTDTDMFCHNLTDDLLHVVFSFLKHVDLCRSAMVCRQWRVASAHEDFWKVLNFKNKKISIEQFENMCQRYPNATKVNVYGVPDVNALALKAATTLRNLEVLTIGNGRISENFFRILGECNRLMSVTIREAHLGSGAQEIHLSHDRLHKLKIRKCSALSLSIRSNMMLAMLNCPLLQHLDIASCFRLQDADIRSAAISCPRLESLDVSYCSCFSNETLREIAQACAGLRILNASYCPNISFESVHFPMLTVLKLHRCERITSASMTWISNSPALEVLELGNCYYLTSVALHLSCLQSLSLVNCLKITELNLQSTMLSSITVSKYPALSRVTITSNALRRLALKKHENLTTVVLQCESLQEVDLAGCKSLSNTVFSDDGRCPMLKSLILDNCESLTEVRFCNSSLSSLSLVGCRAVTSLELKCPRLEQICLDGCDNLETAFFKPVALRSLDLGICQKLRVLSIESPYMVSLDLKCFGRLSEASIICPLLTSLDASFCGKLRDDCLPAITASCPLIESLLLMSCSSIGSDGFSSLKGLQNLIVLDLSYTCLMNLEPIFKSCIQLKVLKIQACKDLTNSSLEPLYKEGALPALEELDLSHGTLCRTVITDLLACCTHLIHLNLNGCVNMHDLELDWGSTNVRLLDYFGAYNSSESTQEPAETSTNRLLQNLSCVGCPSIRKVLIPPAARFYHLSSLNLSLCVNLKEVDIACSNLVLLNLSNCCSLEVLKFGCPRLSTLFLQSCKMDEAGVEAAISVCCSLETLDLRFCSKISSVSMVRFQTVCPSLKRVFRS